MDIDTVGKAHSTHKSSILCNPYPQSSTGLVWSLFWQTHLAVFSTTTDLFSQCSAAHSTGCSRKRHSKHAAATKPESRLWIKHSDKLFWILLTAKELIEIFFFNVSLLRDRCTVNTGTAALIQVLSASYKTRLLDSFLPSTEELNSFLLMDVCLFVKIILNKYKAPAMEISTRRCKWEARLTNPVKSS